MLGFTVVYLLFACVYLSKWSKWRKAFDHTFTSLEYTHKHRFSIVFNGNDDYISNILLWHQINSLFGSNHQSNPLNAVTASNNYQCVNYYDIYVLEAMQSHLMRNRKVENGRKYQLRCAETLKCLILHRKSWNP